MIGFLKGKIENLNDGVVIVHTGNVGYQVEIGSRNFLDDEDVRFYVYTHVRENDIRLFGFSERDEIKLFDLLLGVSGVGPKSAMTIVSDKGIAGVVNGVMSDNPDAIKVSGVGKKTAQKIILELKNKLDGFSSGSASVSGTAGQMAIPNASVLLEAKQALENLGYSEKEIDIVTAEIEILEEDNVQSLIKKILSGLR